MAATADAPPPAADAADTEEVEGGNVRVALPSAFLDDASCSLSSVVGVDVWRDVLDDADRASLRAFLPRADAPDAEIHDLLAKLFATPGTTAARDAEAFFHFGSDATRAWREMRARERHPESMRYRAAIARVERGAHEYETRLAHNRVARSALGMKLLFDEDTPARATPADRARAWRRRDVTPELEEFRGPPPSGAMRLRLDVGAATPAEDPRLAALSRAARDADDEAASAAKAAEEAAERAVTAASGGEIGGGETGGGEAAAARAALAAELAEAAVARAAAAKKRAEDARAALSAAKREMCPPSSGKKAKVEKVVGPEGIKGKFSMSEDF